MSEDLSAPATAEQLRAEIVRRYESLSKRLQQIGRYILDEPNDIALETLAVIASRCGVQPSAIVRFAKSFGFEGASQMQRLFRDGLLSNNAALGYSERVRQLSEATNAGNAEPADLLAEFVEGNTLALQNLLQTVSGADMRAAVDAILKAEIVHVVGFRRSFPVASYLTYSLLQAGKRTTFIDGVAGLAMQQVQTMTADDVLIAISFHPYSEETVAVVEAAQGRGAKVLAISDSLVSPVAKPAQCVLQVRESEVRKFRSLAASMALAQALAINFAFEVNRKPSKRRSGKTA
ncbi:SIS domain-containing protein [Sphingomonas sp. MAH-20]|jgi:DNA-binding MurR/RpiR family transcriptional regulator|uniref:SIS domain-containing protein n=1 Tax=Sphingomonas horti TaxID=2682842 RepID=A0A6I4J5V7_9SPHN|nr:MULTISPECIES: MurR/RpiR family transcriptional regulator [Sphingomonas]MBA2921257.1 MurR/RpiR family transcriptional regulator [Sphingomonas sp. CGMCC 1.13658]MVO79498.1 SIS domain-containing protein [Sphingomonas horti]